MKTLFCASLIALFAAAPAFADDASPRHDRVARLRVQREHGIAVAVGRGRRTGGLAGVHLGHAFRHRAARWQL